MTNLLPGQTVRLKGTNALYRIRSVYSTYQHKSPELSEVWCYLISQKKQESYWLMAQLEPVGKLLTESDLLR